MPERDWIFVTKPPTKTERIHALADGTRTAREIAEAIGDAKIGYVHLIASRDGLPLKKDRMGRPPGGGEPRVHRPRPPSERNKIIAARIASGEETLEQVAKDYKITRERVRQIAKRQGIVPVKKHLTEQKREAAAARRRERIERETSLGHAMATLVKAGFSIHKAALALGINRTLENRLARNFDLGKLTSHGRWRNRPYPRRKP